VCSFCSNCCVTYNTDLTQVHCKWTTHQAISTCTTKLSSLLSASTKLGRTGGKTATGAFLSFDLLSFGLLLCLLRHHSTADLKKIFLEKWSIGVSALSLWCIHLQGVFEWALPCSSQVPRVWYYFGGLLQSVLENKSLLHSAHRTKLLIPRFLKSTRIAHQNNWFLTWDECMA